MLSVPTTQTLELRSNEAGVVVSDVSQSMLCVWLASSQRVVA